jgi:hypothetical protein
MLHCVKMTSACHPAVKKPPQQFALLGVSRQTNSILDASSVVARGTASAVSQPIFLDTNAP